MRNSVATNFARGFYRALADGLSVEVAAESAALLAVPNGKADGYHIVGDLTFSIGENVSAPPPHSASDTLVDYVEAQSSAQMREAWILLTGACASGALSVAALVFGWPRLVLGLDVLSLVLLPIAMISFLLMVYLAGFSARSRATAQRLAEVARLARASLNTAQPADVVEMLKASLTRALGG